MKYNEARCAHIGYGLVFLVQNKFKHFQYIYIYIVLGIYYTILYNTLYIIYLVVSIRYTILYNTIYNVLSFSFLLRHKRTYMRQINKLETSLIIYLFTLTALC